jgi:hypothetical protein
VLEASLGDAHIAVTNLHKHPDLQPGLVAPFPAWNEHSDGRWNRLQERAQEGQAGDGLTREALMDLLGDSGGDLPRRAGGILAQATSVSSVVFEPAAQTMCLSVGETPTGFGPYVAVDWDWDAPVGLEVREHSSTLTTRKSHPSQAAGLGYDLWRAAVAASYERHDDSEQLDLIEAAILNDPTAPSYRLMAGLLLLRQGEWIQAMVHFQVGMAQAQSAFRSGQFRLWLSRTLDVLDRGPEAEENRLALFGSVGPHVDSLKALAEQDQAHPVSRRRLRRLVYSLDLVDGAA